MKTILLWAIWGGFLGLIGCFIFERLNLNILFYSPKSHIKQLWKEILELTKSKKGFDDKNDAGYRLISSRFDKPIANRKNLINALLDYYFDPEKNEKDEEYIRENRPE